MAIPITSTTQLMIFDKDFKEFIAEVAKKESERRDEHVSACQLTREALQDYTQKLGYDKT